MLQPLRRRRDYGEEPEEDDDLEERVARYAIANRVSKGNGKIRVIAGEGWSIQEAFDDAMASDEMEHGFGGGYEGLKKVVGYKQVRNPIRAKEIEVKRSNVKVGSVKTAFIIEADDKTHTPHELQVNKDFLNEFDKPQQAIKVATRLAKRFGVELHVTIKPFCLGNTRIAYLKPVGGQLGRWVFKVQFKG